MYGESCYKTKEGIAFASHEKQSYGIKHISGAASIAALESQAPTALNFDPPGPGIDPVRSEPPVRRSVQSILVHDSNDPERLAIELAYNRMGPGLTESVNADDAWGEEDDLYRFLKGGLMAK